ncbi:MAG: serine/threonine-protein kinase, partial [Dehalococcoidia bacterium]|nr:serine/threonine-protein kinase [Dehalococcoidia bacterium]
MKRPVALKVLRESLATHEGLRRRCEREAQIMAGLAHSNVVAVHDVGEAAGRSFLAMELVDGRSLAEILAGPRMELRSMLALLEKAARGLGAAHQQGIVHRDVKPANILVAKDSGEPKVADFGLAHLADSQTGLTETGAILGTPLYMAPEQITGDRVISPRTDVYALGAVLYEALTGHPPHMGQTTVELLRKIPLEEPAAPRKIDPRVPADVETICLKALEKSPASRYANGTELAEDLRRYLAGEPILATPAGSVVRAAKWIRRHPATSGMTSLAALSILTLGIVIAANAAGRAREKRESLDRCLVKGRTALKAYEDVTRRL